MMLSGLVAKMKNFVEKTRVAPKTVTPSGLDEKKNNFGMQISQTVNATKSGMQVS
jgi:hypothetical protein